MRCMFCHYGGVFIDSEWRMRHHVREGELSCVSPSLLPVFSPSCILHRLFSFSLFQYIPSLLRYSPLLLLVPPHLLLSLPLVSLLPLSSFSHAYRFLPRLIFALSAFSRSPSSLLHLAVSLSFSLSFSFVLLSFVPSPADLFFLRCSMLRLSRLRLSVPGPARLSSSGSETRLSRVSCVHSWRDLGRRRLATEAANASSNAEFSRLVPLGRAFFLLRSLPWKEAVTLEASAESFLSTRRLLLLALRIPRPEKEEKRTQSAYPSASSRRRGDREGRKTQRETRRKDRREDREEK
ncbi:putative transmembrane protein [Toxoplasma gondii GAB2-2007-GAL-DOM2]|uniref:Transmembrane protein n=5 Tax=Toxoplasma gondii TaxID=5811 RepID=S7WJP7_TOXGG|nr:hypothetical protein TGGT1_273080 [Toxoplasma gondii GT1]KAF4642071.1 hypothetical protein TGRH88_078840 [Toxoplasma gondii]KFG43071.1 putative transmembrane protein [Toxoplasma gondii GAB2-2007-GAL-DOM2]KFG50165.1 putative transmembrane protein [Toxoplasma gondii FOU]PUA92353.1 putative transmembrane protein [Toxoplasma gondii TgCATBr9]